MSHKQIHCDYNILIIKRAQFLVAIGETDSHK